MQAPAKDKQLSGKPGKSAFIVAEFLRGKRSLQARRIGSLCFFVLACGIWLSSFGRMGVSQEGLPWYLITGFVAALSVRFLRVEEPIVLFSGLPRNREPLQLQESLSLCFLCVAVGLYAWVGYSLLHPAPERARTAQIVDIQLLSEHDYKNNNEQLPGTEVKDDLKKRSADQKSQMGSLTQTKLFQPIEEDKKKELSSQHPDQKTSNSKGKARQEKEDEKDSKLPAAPAAVEHVIEPGNFSNIVIPAGWKTKVIDNTFQPAAQRSASPSQPAENQPYISEVEPPELVELVENDGDAAAMHVFQKGGKSSGGKGAENGLSTYLKDLHKRIKSAWNPPMGDTRKVQLLFRLKRDGKLAFLRISNSSGESGVDSSAVQAVMIAAKNGQALPKDYSPAYLDVSYTFKYNVDELQEVKKTAAGNNDN